MAIVDYYFKMYNPADDIDGFEVGEDNYDNMTVQELVDNVGGSFSMTTAGPSDAPIPMLKVSVEDTVDVGTLWLSQTGTGVQYGVIGGQTTSLPPWIVKKP